jgi:hypothetical protein
MSSHNIAYPDVPDWLRISEQTHKRSKKGAKKKTKRKSRAVIGTDPVTGKHYHFPSVRLAAEFAGANTPGLYQALNRGCKAAGYYWRYADKERLK